MDATNSKVKTPEAETETPTRIHVAKATPFGNGAAERHPVVVTYKECMKNHAATIGGQAVDGCGEFMPSAAFNPADPTSLKCAACGCHRNFHRLEPEERLVPAPLSAPPALEYRPYHRHHPPPPPHRDDSGSSPNNSPSPPPISSSYYPSAPHMLLALSHGPPGPATDSNTPISATINTGLKPLSTSNSRKRSRTRFTQYQKEQMLELAERVGWKMLKRDEDMINEFCSDIGVDRGVFKVWMHNNKNTFGKKDQAQPHFSNGGIIAIATPPAAAANSNGVKQNVNGQELRLSQYDNGSADHNLGTNGSSSSS